jgi:hypothetical protein
MAKDENAPFNVMSVNISVDESGVSDIFTSFNFNDDISDEMADTYRRLLEGMMIMLATDSAAFLKLSYAADYSTYLRDEEARQIKEEEADAVVEPSDLGGSAVSLAAFRRMKTQGEG